MDAKLIFETGKTVFELVKSVFDLIGNQKLTKNEENRLFEFYVLLQEFVEAKADYFNFLSNRIAKRSIDKEKVTNLLWEGNILAAVLIKRHYEAFRLSNNIDFRIRPYDKPLYEFLQEYHNLISKSLGFGPQEIATLSAYHSLMRNKIKLHHFKQVYKMRLVNGELIVGDIPVNNARKLNSFINLHMSSERFFNELLSIIENFVRARFGENVLFIEQ